MLVLFNLSLMGGDHSDAQGEGFRKDDWELL
jgi:hypothetical protein